MSADEWSKPVNDPALDLQTPGSLLSALIDARETIAEVIRNSDDVIAKKLCSKTLERIDPVLEKLR